MSQLYVPGPEHRLLEWKVISFPVTSISPLPLFPPRTMRYVPGSILNTTTSPRAIVVVQPPMSSSGAGLATAVAVGVGSAIAEDGDGSGGREPSTGVGSAVGVAPVQAAMPVAARRARIRKYPRVMPMRLEPHDN
jgi:hypothetical protein